MFALKTWASRSAAEGRPLSACCALAAVLGAACAILTSSALLLQHVRDRDAATARGPMSVVQKATLLNETLLSLTVREQALDERAADVKAREEWEHSLASADRALRSLLHDARDPVDRRRLEQARRDLQLYAVMLQERTTGTMQSSAEVAAARLVARDSIRAVARTTLSMASSARQQRPAGARHAAASGEQIPLEPGRLLSAGASLAALLAALLIVVGTARGWFQIVRWSHRYVSTLRERVATRTA